jgi:hypothetical protein
MRIGVDEERAGMWVDFERELMRIGDLREMEEECEKLGFRCEKLGFLK